MQKQVQKLSKMKNNDLKVAADRWLLHGDKKKIAEKVDVNRALITQVINGEKQSKNVLDAILNQIETRKSEQEAYKARIKELTR